MVTKLPSEVNFSRFVLFFFEMGQFLVIRDFVIILFTMVYGFMSLGPLNIHKY